MAAGPHTAMQLLKIVVNGTPCIVGSSNSLPGKLAGKYEVVELLICGRGFLKLSTFVKSWIPVLLFIVPDGTLPVLTVIISEEWCVNGLTTEVTDTSLIP